MSSSLVSGPPTKTKGHSEGYELKQPEVVTEALQKMNDVIDAEPFGDGDRVADFEVLEFMSKPAPCTSSSLPTPRIVPAPHPGAG